MPIKRRLDRSRITHKQPDFKGFERAARSRSMDAERSLTIEMDDGFKFTFSPESIERSMLRMEVLVPLVGKKEAIRRVIMEEFALQNNVIITDKKD